MRGAPEKLLVFRELLLGLFSLQGTSFHVYETQQAVTDAFPKYRYRREMWEAGLKLETQKLLVELLQEPRRTRSFDLERPLSSGNCERKRFTGIRRCEIGFQRQKPGSNYSSHDLWEQVNHHQMRRHDD